MSSFTDPHSMYLFEMTNGKKKLAYGTTPEDALEVLSFRLSDKEMAAIVKEKWVKISPLDIQKVANELG